MNFVPRGKKFQPRIPREQLLELTTQELQEKGVEHNSQAKLLNEISHEIYTTSEPIFVQLRGRAFVRNTEPWSRVYSLVRNYLRENEMNNTLETIETELATARTIKHNKAVDSPDVFDKILDFAHTRKKISFKERVKQWKEEDEKLNPKPAFTRPTMREMKQSNNNTQHVQLPKKTVTHVDTKLANTYSQSSTKEKKEKETTVSSKEKTNSTKDNSSISSKTAPIQTKQTENKQQSTKQQTTNNVIKKEQGKEEKKEEKHIQLETIQESDDFADSFEENSKTSSNKSSESEHNSSDIEEIPTTPIPQKTEAPKQKQPEPEPEPEKSLEIDTIDEEDEQPIPLQKQRPTTFAPAVKEEAKVSNKKALLDFEEPEDIAIDFDSDDGDDFITESSAVTNEKSNVNTSQFDSFADDSTAKDEKSKASVQFDSFAKDSFVDETSTVKGESSKQTYDDFDESSKVDVQQNSASNSGSDVEIIEDSSKADVVQQSSSNEFVEIDDWDD